MREIVVISGKGGTGKTSLSASFAYLAKEDAVVCDCDVDAANMHLLLDANFKERRDFYSGELAVINETLCTNCSECFDVCRFDAIIKEKEYHRVDPISCEGCWYCSRVCPVDAIVMQKQKTGDIFISDIKNSAKMVHAKLGFAAENSGKLVSKVKQIAKELALKENKKYVITDGSPGIGCPVIASLSGANLVVLVTEATVSGFHDLKRVHELTKSFRLNVVCIINKYDLNKVITTKIKDYLVKENIEEIGRIPYDESFTEAVSVAKPIVEFDKECEISKQITVSYNRIKNILKDI